MLCRGYFIKDELNVYIIVQFIQHNDRQAIVSTINKMYRFCTFDQYCQVRECHQTYTILDYYKFMKYYRSTINCTTNDY